MSKIKRNLEDRAERQEYALGLMDLFIGSVRDRLEQDRGETWYRAEAERWRKAYNLLDDFEQAVHDFYDPLIHWADEPDDDSEED